MLTDTLLLQKRELALRAKELYVERLGDWPAPSGEMIQVVMGPRRAGKSSFAIHLLQKNHPFGYVNFDDEKLIQLEDYDELLSAIDAVYEKPTHLLFDEIQNLPRWELFVNRLQRQGRRLTLTGSNSHLLSSELSTHLTGRYVAFVIFPFSFQEYLSFQERAEKATSHEKAAHLRVYLEEGGYPEPLVKHLRRQEYLGTLLQAILYKDIAQRYKLRSLKGLDQLTTFLMSNVGKEYSLQRLTEVTETKSVHTAAKYVRFLEQAFLMFSVRRFSWKVREQVTTNAKIYALDNGLLAARGFRFRSEEGRALENAVAVQLYREHLQHQLELFFWKNPQHEEVDFVVKKGNRVRQLIQVCFSPEERATQDREVRALLKASKELRCQDLLILTDHMDATKTVTWFGLKEKVRFLPAWKWLTQPQR